MCLSTILGSSTEPRSGSGRDGIRIPGSTSAVRELHSASALASAFLADSAGAGTTGDTIGITTESFTTTTPTSLTAESSSTTTSIAPVDFMEEPDFTAAALGSTAPHQGSMDSRRRMRSPGLILARSVALITEEPPAAFPHAGSRASVVSMVEVSEAEVFTEAEAVAGNPVQLQMNDDMWKDLCAQII